MAVHQRIRRSECWVWAGPKGGCRQRGPARTPRIAVLKRRGAARTLRIAVGKRQAATRRLRTAVGKRRGAAPYASESRWASDEPRLVIYGPRLRKRRAAVARYERRLTSDKPRLVDYGRRWASDRPRLVHCGPRFTSDKPRLVDYGRRWASDEAASRTIRTAVHKRQAASRRLRTAVGKRRAASRTFGPRFTSDKPWLVRYGRRLASDKPRLVLYGSGGKYAALSPLDQGSEARRRVYGYRFCALLTASASTFGSGSVHSAPHPARCRSRFVALAEQLGGEEIRSFVLFNP